MARRIIYLAVFVSLGWVLLIASGPTDADVREKKMRFEYAAQWVCGPNIINPAALFRVLNGVYATSVLIHNPSDKPVTFRKKFARTFPPAEQVGGDISEFQTDTLQPHQALMVDCQEITAEGTGFPVGAPPPPPPYNQGYVLIQSPKDLTVQAMFTAGPPPAGDDPNTLVSALAVLEIKGKDLRKKVLFPF